MDVVPLPTTSRVGPCRCERLEVRRGGSDGRTVALAPRSLHSIASDIPLDRFTDFYTELLTSCEQTCPNVCTKQVRRYRLFFPRMRLSDFMLVFIIPFLCDALHISNLR